MSKIIEVTVSPTGETKLETRGFVGETCREASRRLEAAIGVVASEQRTAEFYSRVATEVTLQARPNA